MVQYSRWKKGKSMRVALFIASMVFITITIMGDNQIILKWYGTIRVFHNIKIDAHESNHRDKENAISREYLLYCILVMSHLPTLLLKFHLIGSYFSTLCSLYYCYLAGPTSEQKVNEICQGTCPRTSRTMERYPTKQSQNINKKLWYCAFAPKTDMSFYLLKNKSEEK